MEYKFFDNLPPEAKQIRTQVFVDEQGFKNEFDHLDSQSIHLVIYQNGKPAATGRLYSDNTGFHIGRIAVKKQYRGLGLGAKVISLLEQKAKANSAVHTPKTLFVSAQVRAEGFYKKQGFTPEGGEYADEGVPHIKMYKKLW